MTSKDVFSGRTGASIRTALPERISSRSCLEPIPTTPTGRPASSLSVQLFTIFCKATNHFRTWILSNNEEQIEARFVSHQFPEMGFSLDELRNPQVLDREYNSAEAVLQDLGSDNPVHLGKV